MNGYKPSNLLKKEELVLKQGNMYNKVLYLRNQFQVVKCMKEINLKLWCKLIKWNSRIRIMLKLTLIKERNLKMLLYQIISKA